MQFTGLQVCGFFILLISTGLLITAVASNYWSVECPDAELGSIVTDIVAELKICNHRGLWKKDCRFDSDKKAEQQLTDAFKSGCKNIVDILSNKEFKKIPEEFGPWEFSVIVLMLVASLTAFVSLVFAPCCCNRCGWCLVSELIFALLCALAAIGVYAYFIKNNPDGGVKNSTEFLWSFWVAVGGAGGLLIAIILFAVGRSRADRYAYYSHTI